LRRYLTPQRYGLLHSAPALHRTAIAPLLAAIDYYGNSDTSSSINKLGPAIQSIIEKQ